nr:hypothetical protein CFP56_54895 [Quercus suber]
MTTTPTRLCWRRDDRGHRAQLYCMYVRYRSRASCLEGMIGQEAFPSGSRAPTLSPHLLPNQRRALVTASARSLTLQRHVCQAMSVARYLNLRLQSQRAPLPPFVDGLGRWFIPRIIAPSIIRPSTIPTPAFSSRAFSCLLHHQPDPVHSSPDLTMKYSIAVAAALAGAVSARKCQNITVPIEASARNGVFDLTIPKTNIDITNFILDLTQQGKNYTANILEGYNTVSGKYNLAATYCTPDSGDNGVTQVLTHGIGFDRSYWDFSANNYNYSYVSEAVDTYKFSTLSWDRLGLGQSSHGNPLTEIQALLEVDALRALTEALKDGKIAGVPAPKKTVHVGHSFGSEHTYALTAMYPGISDGIALTGFSQNGSFVPYFALGANLLQANLNPALTSYVDGYLADSDESAVQENFFAPHQFDPAILTAATKTGQPVTVGELLTIGGETGSVNNFAGPTLIITGERDIPYCGGNCLAPPTGYANIPAAAVKTLPKASPFQVTIVPNAGHGLNLEYSHPYTYGTINNFFLQDPPSVIMLGSRRRLSRVKLHHDMPPQPPLPPPMSIESHKSTTPQWDNESSGKTLRHGMAGSKRTGDGRLLRRCWPSTIITMHPPCAPPGFLLVGERGLNWGPYGFAHLLASTELVVHWLRRHDVVRYSRSGGRGSGGGSGKSDDPTTRLSEAEESDCYEILSLTNGHHYCYRRAGFKPHRPRRRRRDRHIVGDPTQAAPRWECCTTTFGRVHCI